MMGKRITIATVDASTAKTAPGRRVAHVIPHLSDLQKQRLGLASKGLLLLFAMILFKSS